jgi:putative ABC transport system substrate-binding protein
MPDTFNVVHRQTIIALAARYSLPAIYYLRYFATDGGLISYGPDEIDLFRRTATYVDRTARVHIATWRVWPLVDWRYSRRDL